MYSETSVHCFWMEHGEETMNVGKALSVSET
jgi:hypothetical protein